MEGHPRNEAQELVTSRSLPCDSSNSATTSLRRTCHLKSLCLFYLGLQLNFGLLPSMRLLSQAKKPTNKRNRMAARVESKSFQRQVTQSQDKLTYVNR